MPKLRKPWTAEDDARLVALLEAGSSVVLVAAKLRRSITAVKARSSKLRISVRRRQPSVRNDQPSVRNDQYFRRFFHPR